MYKIGDFSKLVDIPVRTLRYYDQIGVLQPSEIDSFTGYRYYSDENIVECEMIKLLKSLDFTLEEIILYKNNLNEEIIEAKRKEIEDRIYLLKLKCKRLILLEKEIKNQKDFMVQTEELLEERMLRKKYERRNFRKSA